MQHELDELKRKNRMLSDEVKRSKHVAEKPYEQQAGKEVVSVIWKTFFFLHCMESVRYSLVSSQVKRQLLAGRKARSISEWLIA